MMRRVFQKPLCHCFTARLCLDIRRSMNNWTPTAVRSFLLQVIETGSLTGAGSDYLQIDFANEQLGGGVLQMGCVQVCQPFSAILLSIVWASTS